MFKVAKFQRGGQPPRRVPDVHFDTPAVSLSDRFRSFFHTVGEVQEPEGRAWAPVSLALEVSLGELRLALQGTSKTAVARVSSICYRAMGWIMETGKETVRTVYSQSWRTGHVLTCFKQCRGVIIAKPDRAYLFWPSNYQPLVVEDMIAKLLENVVVQCLQCHLEEHHNFPDNQFRGCVR